MAGRILYYVPPEQITNNEFLLECFDGQQFILDTEMKALQNLKFSQLQKICQRIRTASWNRYSKESMIRSIKYKIVFDIPEDTAYITNGPVVIGFLREFPLVD